MNPWDMQQVNPYASQMGADTGSIGAATQGIHNQQAQAPNKPAPSTYPAYPNSYGLGAPINPDKPATNQAQANPNALQGANPWSLIGESNARGE